MLDMDFDVFDTLDDFATEGGGGGMFYAMDDEAEAEVDPPVAEKATRFDIAMSKSMADIRTHNSTMTAIAPGPLNIATMTIMCILSNDRINLKKTSKRLYENKIKEFLASKGVHGFEFSHPDKHDVYKKFDSVPREEQDDGDKARQGDQDETELKKRKTFQNAVIIRYPEERSDRNNKAIKMFCNGALHITGCKTVTECVEVCDIVCGLLDIAHFSKRAGKSTMPPFSLKRFNVQLVNTNFLIQRHRFNLPKLQKVLFDKYDLDACYDPYFHAGLNLKYNVRSSDSVARDVTILTFHSGPVIITGVVNANELFQAYRFITTFLDQHADLATVVSEEDAAKKKAATLNKTKKTISKKGNDAKNTTTATKKKRCTNGRQGEGGEGCAQTKNKNKNKRQRQKKNERTEEERHVKAVHYNGFKIYK